MKNIRLFIGDGQIDFSTEPDILFNFNIGDLTDPTAVKNSFTKQITVEGTQHNNDLFGDIWQIDRATLTNGVAFTGIWFNASKKVPFQLFNNGDVYQEGYCKLDSIERVGQKVVYKISLFGGLGSFFYNLMYKETNEGSSQNTKKSLADLDYGKDLEFTINKETVQDAWADLGTSANTKWQILNFAPAYNGKPKDFSADKALINVKGNIPFPTTKTTGGTTYGAYGGYELATLPSEYTDIETRDLRSYLQRPVIRMKAIIDACCDSNNNGGFTVYKDPTFFNDANPYYEDTWMTLPMLNEYEYITSTYVSGWTPNISTVRGAPYLNSSVLYAVNGLDRVAKKITLTVKPTLNINSDYSRLWTAQRVDWYIGGHWLDPFTYVSKESGIMHILGGFGVQLKAYCAGKLVTTSDWVVFESKTESGQYYITGNREGKAPKYMFGYWGKQGGQYVFKNMNDQEVGVNLTLNLNNRPYDTVKLYVETFCNDNSTGVRLFDSRTYDVSGSKSDDCKFTNVLQNGYDAPVVTFASAEETEYASLTNRVMTQELLLDTDKSPADYLLSYCKMFGLYFLKDPDQKKISILTRHTFYHRNQIKDITKDIDRLQTMTITPTTMDSKWYDWKQEMVEGLYANNYNKTTSMTYGMKRVNTGYEFNAEAKNLYKDSTFKGAVEALEKSRMYSYAPSGETGHKQWMVDGFELTMYKSDNMEETQTEEIAALTGLEPINAPKWPFYDLFPKAQFRDEDNGNVDGRNVLLFFLDKIKTTTNEGVDLNYWLTDDIDIMYTLNDNNPCWIYTVSGTDQADKTIALPVSGMPRFGRYIADENTNEIQYSLDFGEVRQLYVPSYISTENSTIYRNYWKSYIEDLYDVDAKTVDAYVHLTYRPDENIMRDFYYFDNSIWRINKIYDWNLVKENTTKVQFVKVKDVNNYNSLVIYGAGAIVITANTTNVSVTGGDVTFTVTCVEQDMEWWGYDNWYNSTGSIPHGTGDGSFTVHFEAHPSILSSDMNLAVYCTNYNAVSNKIKITRGGTGIYSCGFILPETINLPATSGVYLAKLYHNGLSIDWEIVNSANWLSVQPASGSDVFNLFIDEDDLYITYQANSSDTPRTTTIYSIGAHYTNVCTITQAGAEPTLDVVPDSLSFSANSSTQTLSIQSNLDWEITIEDNN